MIPLTQSLEQIFAWLFYGAYVLFGVLFLVGLVNMYEKRSYLREVERKTSKLHAWASYTFPAVAPLAMLSALHLTQSVINESKRGNERALLGTIVVMMFAGALFVLKIKATRTYAVIELVSALILCQNALQSMQDEVPPIALLGLFTSLYLFVRSADNYRSGRKKAEEEKLAFKALSGSQKITR